MLRALRLIAHIAWGCALCAWLALDGPRRGTREELAQAWHRRLLRIMGIRLHVEGSPLAGAHVTAANHISWLDIPVLGAVEPTRFIAKSEVRGWPIAGAFARAAGTFFIRRGKGGSAPLLEKLVPHLAGGGRAVLFAEGTTTDGTEVRPFHSRLFSAALDAPCSVQPVTIQYSLAPDGRCVAPFIGSESLVAHVARLLRVRRLEAWVRYGPPIAPDQTRDGIAQDAEAYVRAALRPAAVPARPRGLQLPTAWSEA